MFVDKKDIFVGKPRKHRIYVLSDIHVGNINFQRKLFKDVVNKISQDKDSHVILLGDYCDYIVKTDSKRFDPKTIESCYSLQDLNNLPYVQTQDFIKLIEPIKDKILCCIAGNHENSIEKYNNFDPYSMICEALGLPEFGYMGFLSLGINMRENKGSEYRITFSLNHGVSGGGFTKGYPLNVLSRMFSTNIGDLNIMGHTHKQHSYKEQHNTLSNTGKFIEPHRYFIMNPCFLKTYVEGNRNYFENKGRTPSDIGYTQLEFNFGWENWDLEITAKNN